MDDRWTARQLHFERLYALSEDPWDYRTSPYEEAKYHATLTTLCRPTYRSALEVGCSNGELSSRIATRCRRLVALDFSPQAVELARKRLAGVLHAEVIRATIPRDWPSGRFDLIVFSEILYYMDRTEIEACAVKAAESLPAQGEIVLVNWQGSTDTPLSGRSAAGIFLSEFLRCRDLPVGTTLHDGYDLTHIGPGSAR